jgi:hypothetical protein
MTVLRQAEAGEIRTGRTGAMTVIALAVAGAIRTTATGMQPR